MIDNLPSQGEHYSFSLVAVQVFIKISLSLPFIYDFDRKDHIRLSQFRVQIEHSSLVIPAFIQYLSTASEDPKIDEPEDIEDIGFLVKTKQSQKKRKGTQARLAPIFDAKVTKSCAVLEIEVPTTAADARYDLHEMVRDLRDIFLVRSKKNSAEKLLCSPTIRIILISFPRQRLKQPYAKALYISLVTNPKKLLTK